MALSITGVEVIVRYPNRCWWRRVRDVPKSEFDFRGHALLRAVVIDWLTTKLWPRSVLPCSIWWNGLPAFYWRPLPGYKKHC